MCDFLKGLERGFSPIFAPKRYTKAIDFSNCIGSVFTRYGKMFQVNEVEGSVLSWCASRESNMLEIDPTELFRGLQ